MGEITNSKKNGGYLVFQYGLRENEYPIYIVVTTIEINGKSINEISNLGVSLVLSHEVIHVVI